MSEKCQICGKHYEYVYRISDKLWKKITGIKNGSGLRCIDCLDKEARGKDIYIYFLGKEIKEINYGSQRSDTIFRTS